MSVLGTVTFVDPSTGELRQVEVKTPQPRKTSMKSLYKADWSVIHRRTLREISADRDLHEHSLRVLIYLLGNFENGNKVMVPYQAVAEEVGIHPTSASRALLTLARKGVLLGSRSRGYVFNPRYGFRGDPTGIAARRPDGEVVLL